MKAAFYADIMAQYTVIRTNGGRNMTAFFGVDNIGDVQPPLVPGANGSGQSILFDPIGRRYRGGLRFRF